MKTIFYLKIKKITNHSQYSSIYIIKCFPKYYYSIIKNNEIPWERANSITMNFIKNILKFDCNDELLSQYNAISYHSDYCDVQFITFEEADNFLENFIKPNMLVNTLLEIY